MPYFKNKKIRGQVFDLAHLDPFVFNVTHNETDYSVRVTFEDHVFTAVFNPDDHTPDLIYSRRPGDWRAFDERRWGLSRDLPQLFSTIGGHSVYRSKDRNFFFLRGMAGAPPYAVFFDPTRSTHKDADIAVIVRSAYEKDNMTKWASPVSFPRLVDAVARGVQTPLGPAVQIRRR
ncbi:hypothetical protein PH5382_03786 [Phaeobacter sp. CECT 5382]|uniref:hypothetical protein n=1 Tax=Phaeobacter sp. CECT 5382 TaxID=1712645 RepID=UPI0006DA02F2|nr:hypothetical protein [Phaeobacter sp. CECT 5382]CUH89833.1 hypothetical protein PH5382_03786 [Phaeobacter sp. CECT 5382]